MQNKKLFMFKVAISVLLAGMSVAVCQQPAWGKKVALVLSRSLGPYQLAAQGFESKSPSEIQTFNMEGKLERGQQIMASLSPEVFSEVVCIGSEALHSAETYLTAKIPVLYTMVLDSHHLKGQKAGGVLMQVAPEDQFEKIEKLIPGTKKVGVIYNPAFSREAINQARTAAKNKNLTLMPIAVDGKSQVAMALEKLQLGKVDVIWSVVDETMAQPEVVAQTIQFTLEKKIAFIGISVYQVKAGALMAFSADFKDLGAQTAQLAGKMMKSGMADSIETPRSAITYINTRTQKILGLKSFPEKEKIDFVQ